MLDIDSTTGHHGPVQFFPSGWTPGTAGIEGGIREQDHVSLTRSPAHSFIHSFTTHSLIDSSHSPVHPLTHSSLLTHSFTPPHLPVLPPSATLPSPLVHSSFRVSRAVKKPP